MSERFRYMYAVTVMPTCLKNSGINGASFPCFSYFSRVFVLFVVVLHIMQCDLHFR